MTQWINKMKPIIYATSDLHGMLPDPDSVPPCDIFLIAGDVTPVWNHNPAFQESWLHTHFAKWIGAIRAEHKILIAGNHDFVAEERPEIMESHLWTYLCDQAITVEGVKIYGTPWTPPFYNWAFMRPESELEAIYNDIPDGIDILISHGPPRDCCDKNILGQRCGSYALARQIREIKPKIVITGHIHEAHGRGTIDNTNVYNVSHVNFSYKPSHPPVKICLDEK